MPGLTAGSDSSDDEDDELPAKPSSVVCPPCVAPVSHGGWGGAPAAPTAPPPAAEPALGSERTPAVRAVRLSPFGHRYGKPAGADLRFDVRRLPRFGVPKAETAASEFTRTPAVRAEVALIVEQTLAELQRGEQLSELNVAVGCDHGKRRSVAVCRAVAAALRELGIAASVGSAPGTRERASKAPSETGSADGGSDADSAADTDLDDLVSARSSDRRKQRSAALALSRAHDGPMLDANGLSDFYNEPGGDVAQVVSRLEEPTYLTGRLRTRAIAPDDRAFGVGG